MRNSFALWNSTANYDLIPADLSEFAGVGDTPWEENDATEFGLDAPIKGACHRLRGDGDARDHTFAV